MLDQGRGKWMVLHCTGKKALKVVHCLRNVAKVVFIISIRFRHHWRQTLAFTVLQIFSIQPDKNWWDFSSSSSSGGSGDIITTSSSSRKYVVQRHNTVLKVIFFIMEFQNISELLVSQLHWILSSIMGNEVLVQKSDLFLTNASLCRNI